MKNISPKQRLKVYTYCLDELEKPPNFIESEFLCHIIYSFNDIFNFDYDIIDFPEIIARKPKNSGYAWWGSVGKTVDKHKIPRIKVIEESILEVGLIIEGF